MSDRFSRRTRLLPPRRRVANGAPPDVERSQVTLDIRPATDADRQAIAALYVDLKRHHHELAPGARRYAVDDDRWITSIESSLNDRETRFFVAVEDDEVVGFMRLRIEPKSYGRACELDTVVVKNEVRGRGVGEGLIRFAEDLAAKEGAIGMRVNVLSVNERGRAFYQRLGYDVLAIRYGKEL